MRLKSFYGATSTEAMRLVRETLGEDAIIVATRDDEGGGVRVTAAIDDPLLPPAGSEAAGRAPPALDMVDSAALDAIAAALIAHNVPAPLAEKLMAAATQYANDDPLLSFGAALDTHFHYLPLLADAAPAPPLLLIGPPGAGKSLCAAKIAAQLTLQNRPIAVISTDTQRAGGMAQLGAFTRLMNAELMEIEDPHALKDALLIQKPEAQIIIDTAGINPLDEHQRLELASLIKAAGVQPVLVLPADLDAFEASEMAKAFQSLGASRLLPTRLDMTRRLGGMLCVAAEARLPFCAFCASALASAPPQPLNPVSLARLILPKSSESRRRAAGEN